ncbi:MAG: cytochrome c oxidase subunit 3 [Actinomycetes bacterium]
MSTTTTGPLYPTTGEPVAVNARRNRLGVWLCIVSDCAGSIALLIAYSYLWSLNVNNAWAPPKNAWAPDGPFWLIVLGTVLATIAMWWGYKGLVKGHKGRMITGATLATLLILVTFIGQIVQLSTFPFDIQDGAYASSVFWLCIGAAIHLFMVLFFTMAIVFRTKADRITPENPYHARLVSMWMTYVCIIIAIGALFTLVMKDSPNTDAPTFGTFTTTQ